MDIPTYGNLIYIFNIWKLGISRRAVMDFYFIIYITTAKSFFPKDINKRNINEIYMISKLNRASTFFPKVNLLKLVNVTNNFN